MIKKIVLTMLLSVHLLPAQLVNGRISASMYGWQGRGEFGAAQNFVRMYDNMQFTIAQNNFSLSTALMASKDFSKSIATDPELRLSSLVFKARNIGSIADISAGRQFVAAGAGTGFLDGALAKFSLLDNMITVTGFGGLNVVQTRSLKLSSKLSENNIYGAQLTAAPMEDLSIGLSSFSKSRKPEPYTLTRFDSVGDPYAVVFAGSPLEERIASVDVGYDFLEIFEVYGRADYDFLFKYLSRGQGSVRAEVMHGLALSGEFLFREPRVAYNSVFSVFSNSSTKEVEGGVEYTIMPKVQAFARYGLVSYSDENSQRLVVGGAYDFIQLTYTQNFGYAGELNGISAQGVYPLMENLLTPSVAFGYAGYKLDKDGPKQTVVSASIGTAYRPFPQLTADVQYQYLYNPQYKTDSRVFVKFSYWFSGRMNWF